MTPPTTSPPAAFPLDAAACIGESDLFDSVHLADHRIAKAICLNDCQALLACRRRVKDEATRIPGGMPVGTWAGRLYGKGGRRDV